MDPASKVSNQGFSARIDSGIKGIQDYGGIPLRAVAKLATHTFGWVATNAISQDTKIPLLKNILTVGQSAKTWSEKQNILPTGKQEENQHSIRIGAPANERQSRELGPATLGTAASAAPTPTVAQQVVLDEKQERGITDGALDVAARFSSPDNLSANDVVAGAKPPPPPGTSDGAVARRKARLEAEAAPPKRDEQHASSPLQGSQPQKPPSANTLALREAQARQAARRAAAEAAKQQPPKSAAE